jgi:hypothetical protein
MGAAFKARGVVLLGVLVLALSAACSTSSSSIATSPSPSATHSPSLLPTPTYSPPPPPPPTERRIGKPIVGENGTITAYKVQDPAVPNRELTLDAGAGNHFAALDVKVCANSDGVEVGEDSFELQDTESRHWKFWNVQDYARDPRFEFPPPMRSGECIRGWITYIVADGAKLVNVLYVNQYDTGITDDLLTWDL